MAQVDKVGHLPLLFWFVLLFLAIYFYVYTRFLPPVFISFKARNFIFRSLLKWVRTGLHRAKTVLRIYRTAYLRVLQPYRNMVRLIESTYVKVAK